MLADLVATSHANIKDTKDERIEELVQMYRGALHEHGFHHDSIDHLRDRVYGFLQNPHAVVVWIVPGCQGRALMERRALAAAHAVSTVNRDRPGLINYIVFCGGHPPADRVAEPNEAQVLRSAFQRALRGPLNDAALAERIETDSKGEHLETKQFVVIQESESTTTDENIKKAFVEIYRRLSASAVHEKRDYVAAIFSNDFHLLRLSRDFRHFRRTGEVPIKVETQDETYVPFRNAEHAMNLSFRALLLVGSEYFDKGHTIQAMTTSKGFMKRLYFEVLSDFFRRNYFLADADYLRTSNPVKAPKVPNDPSGFEEFASAMVFPAILKQANQVEVSLQLNQLVFEPVSHQQLKLSIENFFLEKPRDGEHPTTKKLLTVNRLGGRFSQPTVRVAGEPHIVRKLNDKFLVRLQLARSHEGIGLAAQYGVLAELDDPAIRAVTDGHQYLPLCLSVLYVSNKGGRPVAYLRRRGDKRYAFSRAWEAAIEGSVYKDDFNGGEILDLRRPIVRLLKKEYLLSFDPPEHGTKQIRDWDPNSNRRMKPWSDQFQCLGYTHSQAYGESYVHGILNGLPMRQSTLPFELCNSLGEMPIEVDLSADGLIRHFEEFKENGSAMLLPACYLTLLYALTKTCGQRECDAFRDGFQTHFRTPADAFAPLFQ